ncbi:MAG: methyltransferase domain-containing protein [Micromonosporaceae bacterium]|nr:methyltransferase domain-containing protein [Micromonosporaceae bacterium]
MSGQTAAPVLQAGWKYALDNNHPVAASHHHGLTTLFDPFSTARTAALLDLTGRRCLEVGAGAGSYARWLAGQVGRNGEVLAIDIKPDLLAAEPDLAQLTVRRVDITDEEQLRVRVGGGWDLIHARLVLGHLPSRSTVLARLAQLLAPGGVLLVEDWYRASGDPVICAPSPEAAQAYRAFHTVQGRCFQEAGTDPTWSRRAYRSMREIGLVDVQTVIHGTAWPGGGTGCALIASSAAQLRPRLLAFGLTDEDLALLSELLNDPRLVLAGHLLYSTSGRRAA